MIVRKEESDEAFETFLTIDVIVVVILFFVALKLGARSRKLQYTG